MYSDKKNKLDPSTQQNRIVQGTKIVGDIISECGFRIDGTVDGTIKTPGKVVIGVTGVVNGTIESKYADIVGSFYGKIQLTDTLTLKSTAVLEGEVETQKLAVEPGATFNATCKMGKSVKELNTAVKNKSDKSA